MKFTEQELLAAFSETVLNGGLIDWDYWVNKMAALTAEQASKLLSGLDPDIFESLKARPNTNDPGNLCRHARNIERAALAENRLTDSPLGWLAWANDKKFKVHDGFVIAVEARERAQAERPQSEPAPAPAAQVEPVQAGPAQPHAATHAPVMENTVGNAPAWAVKKPQRYSGYAAPLHRLLAGAHREGKPCPTARDVVEAWRTDRPAEIAKVLPDGFDYYDSKGDAKTASLDAIRKAIERMTSAR